MSHDMEENREDAKAQTLEQKRHDLSLLVGADNSVAGPDALASAGLMTTGENEAKKLNHGIDPYTGENQKEKEKKRIMNEALRQSMKAMDEAFKRLGDLADDIRDLQKDMRNILADIAKKQKSLEEKLDEYQATRDRMEQNKLAQESQDSDRMDEVLNELYGKDLDQVRRLPLEEKQKLLEDLYARDEKRAFKLAGEIMTLDEQIETLGRTFEDKKHEQDTKLAEMKAELDRLADIAKENGLTKEDQEKYDRINKEYTDLKEQIESDALFTEYDNRLKDLKVLHGSDAYQKARADVLENRFGFNNELLTRNREDGRAHNYENKQQESVLSFAASIEGDDPFASVANISDPFNAAVANIGAATNTIKQDSTYHLKNENAPAR